MENQLIEGAPANTMQPLSHIDVDMMAPAHKRVPNRRYKSLVDVKDYFAKSPKILESVANESKNLNYPYMFLREFQPDGNTFFRAVIYYFFEQMLLMNNTEIYEQLWVNVNKLEFTLYDEWANLSERHKHSDPNELFFQLFKQVKSICMYNLTKEELILHLLYLFEDEDCDFAGIIFIRKHLILMLEKQEGKSYAAKHCLGNEIPALRLYTQPIPLSLIQLAADMLRLNITVFTIVEGAVQV